MKRLINFLKKLWHGTGSCDMCHKNEKWGQHYSTSERRWISYCITCYKQMQAILYTVKHPNPLDIFKDILCEP